jgi:protein tyrosine phosphatase
LQVGDFKIKDFKNSIFYFSAGIGRTGVLILMETALCLIESNQPVFPLDIVRQMREQRLGMIQTFVCHKFD